MKNLLLALAGTLMLSASTNAQDILLTVPAQDQVITTFTLGTINNNGNTVSFQGQNPTGGMSNFTYTVDANTLMMDGFQFECVGDAYIDVNFGTVTDYSLEFSDAAIAAIGIAGCEAVDPVDPEPAGPCDLELVLTDDWGTYNYTIIDVVSDGVDTYVSLQNEWSGDYYYAYHFTATTGNILSNLTGSDYSYSNPWGETVEFTGDFAACVASVAPAVCPEPVVCPEDLSSDVDSLQALLDQANATIAGLYEVNADLAIDLDECEDYTAWADQTISNLQTNLISTSNDLAVWQAAYQTQSDELDSLEAINGNLVAENQELAADLYECQSDLGECESSLATVDGQLDACQDNFANWQLFTAGVQADLMACEAVNDSLLNDLADLTVDLANMTAESDTCFMEYSALDDQFIDAVEEYEGIIDNLNTQLDELADQSVTIITNLQDQLDDCTATSDNLAAQLDDCETAGVAIIAELQSQLLACQGDLADAQEAASACPAAIEAAVANAFAIADEECNATIDSLNYVCWEEMQLAYDAGQADGYAYFEDEVLPELLYLEYELGYNAGQADCGEVSGLVDIDGTTVIPVIGYYNELGQIVDPMRTTGVIIRKHADGTFSKYIKSIR